MAKKEDRFDNNVPGRYYVDEQCINCEHCVETAPINFAEDEDGDHAYVCKQPGSSAEDNLARQAMEECPVEAIGDDGEEEE